MEKILTYMGDDNWGRPVYKDENQKLWKDVDNREGWLGSGNENLASCDGFYGEPISPMSKEYTVKFIPERKIIKK